MSLKQEHLEELALIMGDAFEVLTNVMRKGNRQAFTSELANIRRTGEIGLEIAEHLNGARVRKNAGDRKRRASSKKPGAPKKVTSRKKTPGKPHAPYDPFAAPKADK